ncbi:MAG TPA: molybdenum cofactor guanylyltransferase, partial [Cyanobacteria bacterium UBA11159]|nr:molybdenum cofactor guanylyltransferase [Cyanobacteria bacterium UBA11159]
MQCPILLPGALSELFAQATSSGYITKADRYGLMAALLAEQLDSEQRSAIDRMLHAVRRGRLKIADELSVVATSGTNSLSVTILAGGLSSRMGRDKALLNIDGVPLLQKICQVGLVCTDKVYVLTPWPEKYQEILPNGCQAIEEVTV